MQFYRSLERSPRQLGIFPGAFNPVTVAHMALASAALSVVDEVLFILPRDLPHKTYAGAAFPDRIAMLRAAIGVRRAYSLACTEGGLFVEIAAECRAVYGEAVRMSFLCGRDVAERVAGWDYGAPEAYAGMLREFGLLVAARQGVYRPPQAYAHAIEPLEIQLDFEGVSATEVRARIARGEEWEMLVPAEVREQAARIYGTASSGY